MLEKDQITKELNCSEYEPVTKSDTKANEIKTATGSELQNKIKNDREV